MAIPDLDGAAVLVTGGAGFIGSHLVDALVERGARVRVLDNLATGKRSNLAQLADRIEFIEGDIRDSATCHTACAGVRYVFHQAALGSVPRSMKDPATSLGVNVSGTANIFTAARDAGVTRVVYASSSSVYGDSQALPRCEGGEGRPLSPYALSKRVDEELADTFARCFAMELIGLRYFNVYGPRQDPNGAYAAVIPCFFTAYRRGEAPVIFGDGGQSRDFTAVADVVEANLLAAGAPSAACGRAYNVGAGGRTTLNELVEMIRSATGSSLSARYEVMRPGDVRDSEADICAARDMLGFTATTPLAQGLHRARAYYMALPVD